VAGDLQPEDPQHLGPDNADAPQEPEGTSPPGPESAWPPGPESAWPAGPGSAWPAGPGSAWPPGPGSAWPAAESGQQPTGWAGQRGRLFAVGVIVFVAAIALTFVLIKVTSKTTVPPGSALSHSHPGQAPAAVIGEVTAVPVSALDAAGDGGGAVTAKPTTISGPTLTLHGKPEMLYLGAEFCPYCAAERWAMIVALSRFGTFSGLATIRSAAANGAGDGEPYPDTATWTFAKASYSSPDLTFTPVEELSNIPDPSDGGYTTLQTPTPAQLALLTRYDAPPNVPPGESGAIPFIDLGNKYVIIGSSYSPQVLAGLSWSQIAADLSNPSSPVAKAIDGTANYITAAVCATTGNQPASACTATVRSMEPQL